MKNDSLFQKSNCGRHYIRLAVGDFDGIDNGKDKPQNRIDWGKNKTYQQPDANKAEISPDGPGNLTV